MSNLMDRLRMQFTRDIRPLERLGNVQRRPTGNIVIVHFDYSVVLAIKVALLAWAELPTNEDSKCKEQRGTDDEPNGQPSRSAPA